LNVVSIREFQSYLDLDLLKEISMVTKLTREKIKPLLFKYLVTRLDFVKFGSSVFAISYVDKCGHTDHIITTLNEENKNSIEDYLNDYIISLSCIKKHCTSFYLKYNRKTGYFLYPQLNLFNSLTKLKIESCDIPFEAFINIGKTLAKLNRLELENVDLIKSITDGISEKDTIFPPKLTYLKLFQIQLISTTLLSKPFDYLFSKKVYTTSYEDFSLPKISVPTLKRLDFQPKGEVSQGIEEFLEVNPNVESLLTRRYNLKVTSLKSLMSLNNDDLITFNNIDQAFRLNSINSLTLSVNNFNFSENIRKLCKLCPNIVNLTIRFSGNTPNFNNIIERYLASTLSNLCNLKSFALINSPVNTKGQILDLSKLGRIEKLKIKLNWAWVSGIKLDDCKSLKRVELVGSYKKFTDEFKRNLNGHKDWVFKFGENNTKGYKI
jgi:hypothetical protein